MYGAEVYRRLVVVDCLGRTLGVTIWRIALRSVGVLIQQTGAPIEYEFLRT